MVIIFSCFILTKAVKEVLITENETYCFSKRAIIIESQKSENNTITNAKFSNAISEISNNLIESDHHYYLTEDVSNVMTFKNYEQNEIYICLVKATAIECNYKIMKYLSNNQLMKFQDDFFIFSQTNCQRLYNFVENLFILECLNQNILVFKLIDLNNQLLDILEITSQFNTTFYSQEVDNKLILMENINQSFFSYIIEIQEAKLTMKKNQLNLSIVDISMIGQITSIQIKNDNSLRIFCQYKIFDYYFNSGKIELIQHNLVENYQCIGTFFYMKKEFFVVIDQSNQNEISVSLNIVYFNPKGEKVLSINFINENIIIYCNESLYIYNNDVISLKYDVKDKQILFLEQLPFIISVKQQRDLEFLKIKSMPRCISKTKQQNLLAFYIHQFKVSQEPIIINITKQSTPQFIIQTVKFETLVINQDGYYILNILQIQQGLQFSNSIKQQQNNSLLFANNQFVINKYKDLIWGQEAFIIEHNISDSTIFVINKKAISIIKNNKTISYRFKFSDNNEDLQVRFFIEQKNFIIISKNSIAAFHYDTIIELKWQLRLKKEINKIIQNGQAVNIQLQDCNEVFIQLTNLKYQEIQSSIQFGCRFKLFEQQEIIISKQKIDILPFSNKFSFTFDQIIDFIYLLSQNRIIIFEVIEQKIVPQLYSLQFQELYFYFNLPLYNFTITYPLRYEIFWDQLAIAAKNTSNQQEVLLVYNLNYQLSNILIKVINIDQNQHYFAFLNAHQIVSIYNSSLMITYLKQVVLQFTDQYLDFDTVFKREQVLLEAKTDIYNFTKIIQLDILISHFNYSIKIKDTRIPFLQHYDKQKQISKINFENVFGQIDYVYLLRENDIKKLDPIVITPFLQCRFYSNQVCYNDKEMVLFNSVNQIMIKLPKYCKDLIFIKDLSNKQEIFCLAQGRFLEKYEINQMQLSKKSEYQQHIQINFNEDSIESIIFINNIAIIKIMNKKKYQILLFKENDFKTFQYQVHIDFEIVQAIYENNHYVIFCYDINEFHLIRFVLLTENYSNNKTLQIEISQIITDHYALSFSLLNSLLILNHTLHDMIFESNIILCFITQNCFRINLIIDFQQGLIQSDMINFIRYQQSNGQLQYCLANKYNLIISLLIDEESVIYFYNLSSIKILDSLYRYEGINTTIEYFNETHFVQIKSENSNQLLSFVEFQGYQFEPKSPFKKQIEIIKLNNSVSTLTLEFYPSLDRNEMINFSNKRISLINLVNFILLILFLKTFKNKRIHHQFKR